MTLIQQIQNQSSVIFALLLFLIKYLWKLAIIAIEVHRFETNLSKIPYRYLSYSSTQFSHINTICLKIL